MYKAQLLENLRDDHKFYAEKYAEARHYDREFAEHCLEMMEVISKDIKYAVQMQDGTIGKNLHITSTHAAPMMKA